MNLQQVKDTINNAGFSPEGLDFLNMIINKAIKRGNLEKEEREQIDEVIDIEIEAAQIVADTKKEIAAALNDYADGVDNAIRRVAKEIDDLDKSLSAA
jgi:gas vesicle protein